MTTAKITTARLKGYYLGFWLKSETAKTGTARVIWGLWTTLVIAVVFVAVLSMPVVLFKAFPEMKEYVVAGPAALVWMGLGFIGFLWLMIRSLKWQKEREFEHTAELSDGQVVTLNIKTANGVDYADPKFGGFLKGCQAAAIRDWEGHLKG